MRRRRRKLSVYRQSIGNEYFLRSISDCARRWPHPKRRTKQQQDIEGESDIKERETESRDICSKA